MKTNRKNMRVISVKSIAFSLMGISMAAIIYMSGCTRKNQILDLPADVTQKADLVSAKTIWKKQIRQQRK